jgi:hypothetical protein
MQLNDQKGWLFKGKATKSANTFCRNKPNSPIVQMNVTILITMNYTFFISLTKVKNKPNSNPIKANSKPIKAKTKPIQSQFKPKQTQFLPAPQRHALSFDEGDRIEVRGRISETICLWQLKFMAHSGIIIELLTSDLLRFQEKRV